MARPLRIEYPGAVYHVTSRGNEGKPIFRTNGDRIRFIEYFEDLYQRFDVICFKDFTNLDKLIPGIGHTQAQIRKNILIIVDRPVFKAC